MVAEIQNIVEKLEALDLEKDEEERVEEISSSTIQLDSDRIPQETHTMVGEIEEIVEEALDFKKDEDEIVEKDRPWSDLHDNLLSLIRSRLFAGDEVSFLSVCKPWKLTSILPIRRFHLPISSSSGCHTPCLLNSYNNISDNKIFHPLYNECCDMGFKFQAGTQVYAAKNDWLLLYELQQRLFFFNPFTETKIEIPRFPCPNSRSACFTSSPSSTDWQIVMGGVKGQISLNGVVLQNRQTAIWCIKCGAENWSEIKCKTYFNLSFCSPVIHKGSCYFLDMDANVLIYNLKKGTTRTYMAHKHINEMIYARNGQQYLLTDNAGKLMAVFVGADGCWIQTCHWDNLKKTWKKMPSLGNKTLFVSRASSLCEEASVRGTGNTIYFPRLVNDRCLFYSLSTKRYHTFLSDSSYESFHVSELPQGGTATWIRP